MDSAAIVKKFDKLNIWRQGDQRAPHKPLLILYALSRWARGDRSEIPFVEIDRDVTELLKEFGPPRRSFHPEYPFWRLQNDSVWNVQPKVGLTPRRSNTDPTKSSLLKHNVHGGFSDQVKAALEDDPTLVGVIARRMLEQHFPESIHADILASVGLSFEVALGTTSKRDPGFRKRVLVAYEYRCAICGFDVRLGSVSIGLDAAHIRWHQAGGPDFESNGLALCVLHHKMFDLGVFTLDKDSIAVSDQVHGTVGFDEALLRHHGMKVRKPQRPEWKPEPDHLRWHHREVFKGQARSLGSA
jgi:putative restriction endonuclease